MSSAERLVAAVQEGTEAFLRAWYGEPEHPIEVELGSEPLALRQWWAYERAWDRQLTNQNFFHEPLLIEDGLTLFLCENQSVVQWGYVADDVQGADDDPPVIELLVSRRWHETGVNLSSFLLQLALFEATMGGPGEAMCLDREEVDAIVARYTILPIEAWKSSTMFWESYFFTDGNVLGRCEHGLASGWPEGVEEYWLWFTAHDPAPLVPLAEAYERRFKEVLERKNRERN